MAVLPIGSRKHERTPSTTMNPFVWAFAPLLPDVVRRRVLERERHGFDRSGFPAPTGDYAQRVAVRTAQLALIRQARGSEALTV